MIVRYLKILVHAWRRSRDSEVKTDWNVVKPRIRLIVKILISAYKLGVFFPVLVMMLESLEADLNWQESLDKLNGKFFDTEIKNAVEQYKLEHPEDFQVKIEVDGYDRWKAEMDAVSGVAKQK